MLTLIGSIAFAVVQVTVAVLLAGLTIFLFVFFHKLLKGM